MPRTPIRVMEMPLQELLLAFITQKQQQMLYPLCLHKRACICAFCRQLVCMHTCLFPYHMHPPTTSYSLPLKHLYLFTPTPHLSSISDSLCIPHSASPLLYSGVSRLSVTGNYELRTCPRALRGGYSGIRTHDPPVEMYRLNQCATTPHKTAYQRRVCILKYIVIFCNTL